MENKIIDDGSLSFLKIERNKECREFNCRVITQQELVNREFYLVDFLRDIQTKNGLRYLVFIKFDLKDSELEGRKFFTNSQSIKYILDKIEERNAFPRKVTLKRIGNKFILE